MLQLERFVAKFQLFVVVDDDDALDKQTDNDVTTNDGLIQTSLQNYLIQKLGTFFDEKNVFVVKRSSKCSVF